MKIKNSQLIIAILFLFILYLLSFLPKNGVKKIIKTALLNPKYKEELSEIQIENANASVLLKKINGFWFVSLGEDDLVPCEVNTVENFINELVKVRKLYKISDKNSGESSVFFENSSTFNVRFLCNGTYFDFYFGSYDFSKTLRYFMSGKNTTLYQLDLSLDAFLSSNEGFWCCKTVISKDLAKIKTNADVQSVTVDNKRLTVKDSVFLPFVNALLDLRHGGAVLLSAAEKERLFACLPASQIFMELGNKTCIFLTFYKMEKADGYAVFVNYDGAEADGMIPAFKISDWTLSELFGKLRP